jgi:pyrroloquinoline quinone biosynthesis protein B
LRIVVLGSAAGGGFPQWNCNCTNCQRARAGDPAALPRTQSSLAVSADGERWLLLNASPDLRQQIIETPALHPRDGARHSPIAAVLLTNADVDHVAGLLTIRERWPFSLYATERVHATLTHDSIFNVLNADLVVRRRVAIDEQLPIADAAGSPLGLDVTVIPVPGKVALYLENQAADENFGTVPEDTVGLVVTERETGASFVYVPGCGEISPVLAKRLDGEALVLFDGTVWQDDEMSRTGVGAKTGRRMGHMPISGNDGSLTTLRDIRIDRRIYVHINNTNPILLSDSAERAAVEAAGWEVAYDGMEFVL